MQIKEKNYELYNNDCIEQLRNTKDETFDFSIFSPPFAELYTYSDDIRDMGNSKDYNQFFNHFNFEFFVKIFEGRLFFIFHFEGFLVLYFMK